MSAAIKISEQLRQSISLLEFDSGEDVFSVTVSIGVSQLLNSADSLEEIIKRSDDALYKAKESGRNRVVSWKDEGQQQ